MTTVSRHTPGSPCWFDLMTSDPDGARAFYAALFGWSMEIGAPEFAGYTTARLGERRAAGIGPMPPGVEMPSAWSMYFATDSARATAEAIVEAGGRVTVEPMEVGPHGWMLVATDPAGAAFGAWQPKAHTGAEVLAEPGGMAWCEVNTPDAEGAVAFYGKVFGLVGKKLEGPMPTAYYTLHKDLDAVAGVLQMNEQWAGVPPHWMMYFAVGDADAACARIVELGGAVSVPAFDMPYGRMAVVNDPHGAVFSIIQPAKRVR